MITYALNKYKYKPLFANKEQNIGNDYQASQSYSFATLDGMRDSA